MNPLRLALPILLFALSGCDFSGSPIISPRPDSIHVGRVPFAVSVPPDVTPVLELNGVPLSADAYDRKRNGVFGTFVGLAPGVHTFRVSYPGGALEVTGEARFEVGVAAGYSTRGSIEQVFVTHAAPARALELVDAKSRVVATGETDDLGSLIFRGVAPGKNYRVVSRNGTTEVSPGVGVDSVASSLPPREFYESQTLGQGYGYITTRDGTQLSVYVSLPGPIEDGPYPTVVNYSGYDPSRPGAGPLGGIDLSPLCGELPVLCNAPNHPGGLIAGVLGYASVGVNMRGTGCSGGAYDFFEPLQLTDGYDLIEIIAAQDWVAHNHVGMVGISYPGISQLFTASTKPPGLAAITPLSVISGVDTTLGPGGIINNGFAIQWATRVLDRADPYGQGWEQELVDAGDSVCEENQLLHAQKVDIIQKAYDFPFYVAEVYDPLNPRTFVDEIEVPVFTSGAWQDEQTGGHFPDLWDRFTGAPVFRFTGYNGAHADGYSPQVLIEWKHFLDFYVAREVSDVPEVVKQLAPLLFFEIFGAGVPMPEHRFLGYATFEEALAAYEAEPEGRVLFESGGAPTGVPGAPVSGFEMPLETWPPAETAAERWYFNRDGSLRRFPPSEAESASAFEHDDEKGAESYDVNEAFEKATPDISWQPEQEGRQVVFLSEPLAEDLSLLGHASADLWIQSSADDADLEVTLSEVRPDGQESYISSGWLRASRRALAADSTPLRPRQTQLEADAAPLPAGEWTLARVEIYPFGHVLRAGSRLRVSVSTPGGNKGLWKFEVLQLGEGVTHSVSHSAAHPSSVLLPTIPGLVAPTPLPACPAVRSQPCREHVPHVNALAP
jgi:predicted acyl esterase